MFQLCMAQTNSCGGFVKNRCLMMTNIQYSKVNDRHLRSLQNGGDFPMQFYSYWQQKVIPPVHNIQEVYGQKIKNG